VGDRDKTDGALANAEVKIQQRLWFQRCHPAPLEPCGIVADMNKRRGASRCI